MNNVILKVTPFSYRILIAKYGSPVKVSHQENKDLCDALQKLPIQNPDLKKAQLTEEFHLIVSGRLAQNLTSKKLPAIGLALHADHIRQLHEFMYAQKVGGIDAYSAMQTFYKLYDIGEDDYSMDSAYRNWVRFIGRQRSRKAKRTNTVRRQTPSDVLRLIERLKEKNGGREIGSVRVQRRVLKYFKMSAESLFLAYARGQSQVRPLSILLGLWYDLSGLSIRKMASKIKKTPSTTHHHIKTYRKLLAEDHQYRATVYSILEQLDKVLRPRRQAS